MRAHVERLHFGDFVPSNSAMLLMSGGTDDTPEVLQYRSSRKEREMLHLYCCDSSLVLTYLVTNRGSETFFEVAGGGVWHCLNKLDRLCAAHDSLAESQRSG